MTDQLYMIDEEAASPWNRYLVTGWRSGNWVQTCGWVRVPDGFCGEAIRQGGCGYRASYGMRRHAVECPSCGEAY